jgi:hypothetical protein
VADAPNVIGFDPFERLVDYLTRRAERSAWTVEREAPRATSETRNTQRSTLYAEVGP